MAGGWRGGVRAVVSDSFLRMVGMGWGLGRSPFDFAKGDVLDDDFVRATIEGGVGLFICRRLSSVNDFIRS